VVLPYAPMMPAFVPKPFHLDGWVYEEKVDGWRIQSYAYSCNGNRPAANSPPAGSMTTATSACDPSFASAVLNVSVISDRRLSAIRAPLPRPARSAVEDVNVLSCAHVGAVHPRPRETRAALRPRENGSVSPAFQPPCEISRVTMTPYASRRRWWP
jgi:hypothetical protein